MDWQQITALAIVAITAAILIGSRLRRRRFSFDKDTHCGCTAPAGGSRASITFHARKGERPRTIVKMN